MRDLIQLTDPDDATVVIDLRDPTEVTDAGGVTNVIDLTDPIDDADRPAEDGGAGGRPDHGLDATGHEFLRRARLSSAPRWALAAKRFMDVAGSTLLLVLGLPVLIACTLLIALTSPGPVLYRQVRVGRGGEPFVMLKFRSMTVDADKQRATLVGENEADGPVFKIKDDPRVTRIGRLLRKLSLDELPQLINVIRGEMSLVGPRPAVPGEVAKYGPREKLRLLADPGLTCIWQVSGRSDIDFHRWVDMDLEYIRRWSLGLDLVLLLRTIPAVLSGRGAY